jgi:transcriptional regulator with XRE-family HTH domain
MTPKVEPSRKARRAALGAELKRARLRASLRASSLARTLGMNAAVLSRVESGDRPVSVADVRAWAAAVNGAAGSEVADGGRLEWLAEQALTEAVPIAEWRASAGAAGIQDDIYRRLELPSRYIGSFCPCYLTGLLQTPEYARRLYSLFLQPGEVAAAVAARMTRQQVLYEPGRRIEFVLTEAALRWRSGPRDFLVPQMDRLVTVASLPGVALYVIPSDADMHTPPLGEFTLYDDRDDGEAIAAMETQHDYLEFLDAKQVQPYREELDLLRRSALNRDQAAAFIRDLGEAIARN